MAYSQNYSAEDKAIVDERFYVESVTSDIINNDIKLTFHGVNSCTIFDMETVEENDYRRTGTMRYGELVEIGNDTQDFTLSQDKSFSISIDRANREDTQMVPDMDDAIMRQIREVSIPTVDAYRLSVLTTYAVANSQATTQALAYNTIFKYILEAAANLMEANIMSLEDMVVYITPTTWTYLMRDPEFKTACDTTNRDRAKGTLGTVAGMTFKNATSDYYVANFGFMIVSKKVLISPVKFNSIKNLDGDSFGIDGQVGFGRRYYDAFIPSNKGEAIWLHLIA